jgi:hypothetical protein
MPAGTPPDAVSSDHPTPLAPAHWQELVRYLRHACDPLVGACVYCGRLRTLDGVWRPPEGVVYAYLHRNQLLSHTCCPDCLEAQGIE